MSFIEHSDHMNDQWSKPKPKPRFKHIENKTKMLEFKWFIYKARKTVFDNLLTNSIANALKLWLRRITSLIK